MIDNKNNFYFALANEGWYLPDLDDKCTTFSYLWNIFLGNVYRIKTKDVKISMLFKKASKIELWTLLETLN